MKLFTYIFKIIAYCSGLFLHNTQTPRMIMSMDLRIVCWTLHFDDCGVFNVIYIQYVIVIPKAAEYCV